MTDKASQESKTFKLPYEDLIINKPQLMGLISSAMTGVLPDQIAIIASFQDMTKSQSNYFSNLISKIFVKARTKAAEKEASDFFESLTASLLQGVRVPDPEIISSASDMSEVELDQVQTE